MIEEINSPKDLKGRSPEELRVLAGEIRQLIIEVVSKKGGHLASSLGACELCIGLHYCLDTPRDTIIFDVGHQVYAHKIITGRRESFSRLRERGGISGFPNPQESAYDPFISGHASTAVSWAQGIAEAKKLTGDHSKTVAVIGDGSLTGGMCFEALNSCGHLSSDVFIILNHNEMSISPSVGALSNYLTKLISLPIYNKIKNELEGFVKHLPFADKIGNSARRFEEAVKGLIVPGLFFEELGFRYFGPIDGHDLDVLISTVTNVAALSGPRVLHVLTKKGKGCSIAEENPEDFHGAPPFNAASGVVAQKTETSYTDIFAQKLLALAKKDKRIVAITAAMPKGTGLSVFAKELPRRLFDVGIAEEHAVGSAAGFARANLRPFVAIYSTFLQRSFDQLIHDVALQNLPVTFCIDRAGFVGEDGPTHHGVFDIAYLRMIPHFVVMAPKDKEELEAMLEFSLTLKGPSSIRYGRGNAYSLGKKEKIALGKAQRLTHGDDFCILALGSLVKEALTAQELLKKDGVHTEVVNMRFVKPLDEALLRSLAERFKVVATLEEGVVDGGFGSSVLEFYERSNISTIAVKRWGIPCEFSPFATRGELLELYGLDGASLHKRVAKTLKEEAISLG